MVRTDLNGGVSTRGDVAHPHRHEVEVEHHLDGPHEHLERVTTEGTHALNPPLLVHLARGVALQQLPPPEGSVVRKVVTQSREVLLRRDVLQRIGTVPHAWVHSRMHTVGHPGWPLGLGRAGLRSTRTILTASAATAASSSVGLGLTGNLLRRGGCGG